MAKFLTPRRDKLLQIVRDPQRKRLLQIAWEAAVSWRTKGVFPRWYFKGLGYRRHMGDPRLYLDNEDSRKLWHLFMRSKDEPLLGDKLLFQRHFEDVPGVRLPRLLGHSEPGTFHFADGAEVPLTTSAEAEGVLGALLDGVRRDGGSSLFVKTRTGLKGAGAFRVSAAEPEADLWERLQRRGYVFQQTLTQHPTLAAVAPDALNTMRIMTLRRGREEPELASAWIRFGRRGAIVDNASAGGLFNGVDLATGRLRGRSMTKFERGGGLYTHHPDTGHPLVGFEVPEFAAACDMALAAARHVEYAIVGWDVAVAPDGPVVVEGNSDANYISDQTANGVGYLAHPVLGPFVRESLKAAAVAPPAPEVPYGPRRRPR